jgi:RNA polymerase sigma-70 factor (ECF subfamily)
MSSDETCDVATWMQQHSQVLRNEARRLLRGRPDAEDLVQDVWLRLLDAPTRLADLREGNAGRAVRYLRSMLRNRFIDVCVRRHHVARREPLSALDSIRDNEPLGPEQLVAEAQASAELHAALAQLPAAQREVLALWSQSMSIRDMCDLTGAPLDTVLNRRKYGLARLRKTLVHRTPQHTQRSF